MERASRVHLFLAMVYGAALAAVTALLGVSTEAPWAVPAVLFFFLLAYQFDVKVPGLGSINVDQAIAFPAVVLLGSPVLAGALAGLGMAGSRLYRRGLGGFRLINAFDSVQTALSVTLGCWCFLTLTRALGAESVLWFLVLILAMSVSSASGWVAVLSGHALAGRPVPASRLWKSLLQSVLWIVFSSPFVALVVGAIEDRRPLHIFLAAIPLLVVVWTLKLNARLEERNEQLLAAGRKQEFLQSLTARSDTSLESEEFLGGLLQGLRSFVPWERGGLLVLPMPPRTSPLLIGVESPLPGQEGLSGRLAGLLERGALRKPIVLRGEVPEPFLLEGARSRVLVGMATSEVVFGVLVAERGAGSPPFRDDEVLFLELALSEVAHLTQEGVLRGHLLATNQKLVQQMGYLRQILQISDLLRVHLDVQAILDRVAAGIREGLGFRTVLISLYHEDEGHFERISQAGDDERWEEIRAVKPPAREILDLLQERYRTGNCYFISHTEGIVVPSGILPVNPAPPRGPDDWDPMDLLLVALKDKDDRLLGVISVDEPEDGKIPSDEAYQALEILANQTVHALESAQVHAQIKRQATTDGLTGLVNHAHFQRILAAKTKELQEARAPYTILMMDLDNFKDVNDTFGHLTGDAVLRAVGHALASSIRREDVAARYGGEEFAVLLPQIGLLQSAPIAERIRKTVQEVRAIAEGSGGPVRVTVSIGMAACPEDGADHQRVLEQADAALYRAKKQGKNQVCRVS